MSVDETAPEAGLESAITWSYGIGSASTTGNFSVTPIDRLDGQAVREHREAPPYRQVRLDVQGEVLHPDGNPQSVEMHMLLSDAGVAALDAALTEGLGGPLVLTVEQRPPGKLKAGKNPIPGYRPDKKEQKKIEKRAQLAAERLAEDEEELERAVDLSAFPATTTVISGGIDEALLIRDGEGDSHLVSRLRRGGAIIVEPIAAQEDEGAEEPDTSYGVPLQLRLVGAIPEEATEAGEPIRYERWTDIFPDEECVIGVPAGKKGDADYLSDAPIIDTTWAATIALGVDEQAWLHAQLAPEQDSSLNTMPDTQED